MRGLIYFLLVIAITVGILFIVTPLLQLFQIQENKNGDGIMSFGVLYVAMSAFVLLLTWLMRKFVDRNSFKSLGFKFKPYKQEAIIGFLSGTAMLGLGSLVLIALGYVVFTPSYADPAFLALELALMIVVSFIEELIFRGYLLNNLMQSMNKWVALGVTAVLFAAFHSANPDVSILSIVNILVAGIFLGLNYIYTKNLWFSIFFHFSWNFFQGPILGYDVSGLKLTTILSQISTGPDLWTGGAFGFEGSLLCPILFILFITGFTYLFVRRYTAQKVS